MLNYIWIGMLVSGIAIGCANGRFSEIETAIACGLTCVQFFPAQASGGTAALRAFAQAYPQMRFLVSGGIDRDNLHEFLGDAAVHGGTYTLETDGDDTWIEFGVGANFNLNKNLYGYVDLERTEGADLDEDWRANVGVRYSF